MKNLPKFNIKGTTLGQLTDIVADQFPDNIALHYPDYDIKNNFLEFNEICKSVAKSFIALGIEKGEHIAIWANNIPEWVYTQFGSAKAGVTMVTVNTSYRAFELEYLLKQSDSTTLILVDGVREKNEYYNVLKEICPELKDGKKGNLKIDKLPKLKNIIYISEEKLEASFSWSEFLKKGSEISDMELENIQNSTEPDDVINMQYTSGTTGFPKGVMLSHTNIIGNAVSLAECMAFSSEDVLCIPVPFFHCFGCVLATMACMVSGATMVPILNFKAKKVLKTIEKTKATAVHGVPTMFIAMLEELSQNHYSLNNLRTGIMAGSICPVDVMTKVIDVMGINELCITYGQTEASPGITMTRTDDDFEKKISTVGCALPNVEVKIIDPDTNEELPYGKIGELCCRGYNVMKGYYNNSQATGKVIDKHKWLHTKDMAVMDENGYCKILGRIDDTIIRGGENIYPKEVEEYLYTHKNIKDVNVVGVPSEKYGEEVCAFIQTMDGNSISIEEIKEFCKEKIAYYKIPAFCFVVEDFPKTASGKIQKYKLREQARHYLKK